MTPTRKSNTAYPHFPESAALAEDKSISSSPRGHNNRKRVRHRPRSRGGSRKASSFFLQHTPSPIQPAPPTAMSIRYSYAGETALRLQMMMPATTSASRKQWHLAAQQQSATCPCSSGRREGLWERDRRIFGGGEGGSEEEDGLKAPMLDVVLGLFHGLDYDDDDACC